MTVRQLSPIETLKRPWITKKDKRLLDFASNDYLDLRFNPDIKEAYKQGIDLYGVGSGGSPLICGYDSPKYQFEEAFSDFLGVEKSLFLGSGYSANLSVFSALFEKEDVAFFLDKSSHASIYDALSLRKSSYQLYRYPHQNFDALERLLLKSKASKKVIVSEGIFSMTGFQAPIELLVQIKNRHNALLIIDDAHCIGVKGKQGKGSAAYAPQGGIDILICPLGKAFSMQGAMIGANKRLINDLIQKSRAYIYSTAPSSALVTALHQALTIIKSADSKRLTLERNIQLFNQLKNKSKHDFYPSQSAIQFLKCHDLELSNQFIDVFRTHNIFCYYIQEPTVAPKNRGFRLVLSSAHEASHIEKLFNSLAQVDN